MSIVKYLPCGCGIDSEGGREYCPKCISELNKPMSEQDKLGFYARYAEQVEMDRQERVSEQKRLDRPELREDKTTRPTDTLQSRRRESER